MINKIKCLNQNLFSSEDYQLLPLRKQDIQSIREWRNNQIEVLRQKKIITEQDQIIYYEDVVEPLFAEDKPEQILFSFLKNDRCIGYGGLVHISWDDSRAELSFLLDDNRSRNKEIYLQDFSTFIRLSLKIGFSHLKLNKIFTETYDIRDHHVFVLEMNGFKREGVMREHVYMNGSFINSIIHSCLKGEYYE